ncbi:MAG: UDP-N-acetylmuramoyl-tripeptide--D-alanyl-D-alanine ligase [Chloroflexi bacterium]|nr:UDP-N-acetylmuramoyl-tripeptide--D-alanyl-D-alanine ligase [Chloroflexota bacterium]
MNDIAWSLVPLIWWIGSIWRCRQLALYLQQEAYESRRFLWAIWQKRLFPVRAAAIALLAVLLTEAAIVHVLAAILAVSPLPWRAARKNPLRWTARLWRLLLLTGTVIALVALCFGLLIHTGEALHTAMGAVMFAAAPIWLAAANQIAEPIEALIRRSYRKRAAAVLAQLQPTVVGITGSWGKTSTKHFLAGLLDGRRRVYATPKSYNTLMGVTLAINQDLHDDHSIDTFLVEMGAYRRGEIAEICQLAQPQIAILIDIGPQHLERFGSLEATQQAKFELVDALPEAGLAIYNWDSEWVREGFSRRSHPQRRIAISQAADAPEAVRFVASDVQETLAGLAFCLNDRETGESARLKTQLYGTHNVTNLLLASAAARHFGISLEEIAWRASQLQAVESRLEKVETAAGITILNDGYSANPLGARSALQTLGLHETGRRLLVTPGMVELGAEEAAANLQLGSWAAQYATDVILVDEQRAPPIAQGLCEAGFPKEKVHIVGSLAEAVAWYQQELRTGDAVLFLNDLPDVY